MIEQLPDATEIAQPLDFPPTVGDRVDVTFWSGERLRGTSASATPSCWLCG